MHKEAIHTTINRGQQIVEIPPLLIDLPLESTAVAKNTDKVTEDRTYTINFSENKILTGSLIFASASENRVAIAMAAWGEFETTADDTAKALLERCFVGLNFRTLASKGRTDRIAAALTEGGVRFFFVYDVAGDLHSKLLADELERSMRVRRP